MVDDEDKGFHKVETLGGTQTLAVVNESGLFTVLLRSNNPVAKPLRRWVTAEVLPTIRKTGSFAVAAVESPEQFLARALTVATGVLAQKDEVILEMTPRAEAYDRLAGSPTLIKIEVAARKAGIGRTTAFKLLRDNGIFSVYGNTPKSQHAHRFEEVPTTYKNRAGEDITTFTTKVHADSLVWLVSTLERFAADPAKEIA
jgi:phage antirepressor YoqD-like protein